MRLCSTLLAISLCSLFLGCKSTEEHPNVPEELSIFNKDNYTTYKASYIPTSLDSPDNNAEVYYRDIYKSDLIPTVSIIYQNDFSSADAMLDFLIFTYSGEVKTLPDVRDDIFTKCSYISPKIHYELIKDPKNWIFYLGKTNLKLSKKYGPYSIVTIRNFSNSGECEKENKLLITPMACNFIYQKYTYPDKFDTRALVHITFESEHQTWDIVCLADSISRNIIENNYEKIITDRTRYYLLPL